MAELKKPDFSLEGKVAIVTGSSRGIGNAIAKALASQGAKVVISAHLQSTCDRVAEEINLMNGCAVGIACDVTDAASRENLIQKTVEAFGRLDILVNNAGIGGQPLKMLEMTEEYYDKTMNVDLKAVYFLSKSAARQMVSQGCEKGTHPYRIINMSSAAAIKSPIGDTVYGSAKAAVAHLTSIMANELARYGITCNCLAPGYVYTDMTKDVMADEKNAAVVNRMITLRRYAMPEEIASVVAFIASPASGYLTGNMIPVDGGMTIN